MILFALLPFLVFFLITTRIQAAKRPASHAVVTSALLCSLLVLLITEILSALSLLNSLGIIVSWLIALLVLVVVSFNKRKSAPGATCTFDSLGFNVRMIAPPWIASLVISLVLFGTFLSAVFGTPNTCDALIYHIPRVLHWSVNQSVDFYPTPIQRQLTSPPLFEYWLLHLFLLTGSDRLFNLVQWSTFALCVALAVSFAREIGLNNQRLWVAALYAATLPIAILQASSPKNDLFFAFHMCCFAYWLLLMINRFSWVRALLSGVSMGLSLATKGTAFLFIPAIAIPFGLYWLIGAKELIELSRRAASLAVIAIVGILLASPHMIRSYAGYGTISSSGPDRVVNGDYRPSALAGNAVRMLASNIATPFPAMNSAIQRGMEACIGGELHNKSNIYLGESGRRFALEAAPTETKMSNPLHFVAWLVCCVISLFYWRCEPRTALLGVCSGMMFLAITGLIQWSPWVTRLHLPFLILGGPLIARFVAGGPCSRSGWAVGIALVSVAAVIAAGCACFNVYRPIIPFRSVSVLATPRYDQYFMYDNSPRQAQFSRQSGIDSAVSSALAATRQVGRTRTIGLICSPVSTEYLWWKSANRLAEGLVAFRHMYVENSSSRYRHQAELPDSIVVTSMLSPRQIVLIESDGYRCVSSQGPILVYARR